MLFDYNLFKFFKLSSDEKLNFSVDCRSGRKYAIIHKLTNDSTERRDRHLIYPSFPEIDIQSKIIDEFNIFTFARSKYVDNLK